MFAPEDRQKLGTLFLALAGVALVIACIFAKTAGAQSTWQYFMPALLLFSVCCYFNLVKPKA